MLHLLKGRAGSGKTARMRQIISELAEKGNSRPLLLVPEQFSFETERTMLKLLGPKKLKCVDIFSFPRMAFSELKKEGVNITTADNGVKIAIMSEALVQLEGRLNIFSDIRHNSTALNPLVDFCKELKYCCIDSDTLNEKLESSTNSFLKNKLTELDLIRNSYEALLSQSYFDDTDAVSVFTELAVKNNYFKNKTIFLDGFRSFSKQELECLKVAFSQCDDAYITICADEGAKKFTSLYYMKELENKLRTIASKTNTAVDIIECKQSEDAFAPDISRLEKVLFSTEKIEKSSCNGDIVVAKCSDAEDEATFVASTIKKLLKSGEYRCRDIAVIERTNGTYKKLVIDALKKLSIPVFDDSRQPLATEALFINICSALQCITKGLSTESLMSYLKTGLTDLSLSEISRLEKYALVWDLKATGWQKDFTMHPQGFGNSLDEKARKELEELNAIRKKAVLPLLKLKKNCQDADGKAVAKAVYEFIIDSDIKEKLYKLTVELDENGFSLEANRQEYSWNALMHILDTMAIITENKFYSLTRWVELFMMLVSSGDMGEIPQGLDEVTVGCADRIRLEKARVVFLVGVNKEEFPLVSVGNGILTDADRVLLTNLGIEVRPPFEDTVDEERFIAYCAVTAASEKLYLTYKCNDGEGGALFKSEIISAIEKNFENFNTLVTTGLPVDYFIESEDSAFSVYSKNYLFNNEIKSTLKAYFDNKNDFEGKLKALEILSGNKPFGFENSKNSTALFGENVYISASKVESFYNCPFAYFMRYGLGAEPLREASLDPAQSGTIIHLVMEEILKKYPRAQFINTPDDEIRATVTSVLKSYLEEKMGGADDKNQRFMRLFNRLVDISMAVIERIKVEFGVGSFAPCDFELRIGGENIPAYELPLEEGKLKVTGSIDRVDLMEKDGVKYLRVVDYKTGQKEFKLAELFDGLNIQMVLYLMALVKNGKEYYGEVVPSGVLYLPSRLGLKSYLGSRMPSDDEIADQKRKSGRLSGMVLDSPVVFNGMGVDAFPDYFPVAYNAKGGAKGNYYTLSQFKALSKIIDEKIISMGNALHNGEIAATPIGDADKNEGKMCSYCSYRPVCARENGESVKPLNKLTHIKALERLDGEEIE
ncbi:MAG: PD-(D/E)XK nuclease family protein [Clostridia bacterium]|nr:PD-(D/E)XK nuclease family protein [Clostridia bacterium]